ncbi:MAG: hypothetical protein C3L25_04735 [Candidatus Sedimenticola endophacoides]|uniref:Radical SAM core domain-containing protein n=1 Tax=Candidatus Sedimenticola endophacoides TaxID=2548426 RepID=A0A6N4E2T5_9GAMM|nr:MAG: hypothetical protein C3L26_04745 [Candidatus Sedimenticola endophacoides]PUE04253.1 MAG: hypothetical protein C3L25_04735 [Candidatus Sedimenticola endophacoides]PUE05189.1 MAG: hypothetical protein C3L24_01710 [Candidatus Sedimenticola endophacoides]
MYDLNVTAARIVEQCDGKTSISAILRALFDTPDFGGDVQTFISDVLDCLLACCERGLLAAYSSQREAAPIVTGTYEYYTPRHLSVELTDGCNLLCRHCYRNSAPGRSNHLPGDLLIRILRDFSDHGLMTVELTGGEATTHPEFSDVLQFCCSTFQKTALLTNGFDISQEVLEIMARWPGRVVAQVDLDGGDAASHDWLRGEGSYANAVKSIRAFVKHGIPLRVSMNVHNRNLYEIQDVMKHVKTLGAKWFAFTTILPLGRGRSMGTFTAEEFSYLRDMTDRLSEEYPDFFR